MIDVRRENLITLEEAAKVVGCSESTIRNWVRQGLETVKLNRIRRTTRSAIQDFMCPGSGQTGREVVSRETAKSLEDEFGLKIG